MFTTGLALTLGHADETRLKSGVTVIVPDRPAVASVHVAGGGPGTRETDLLRPDATVAAIDAVVLSGGSAYGLAAADGVHLALAEEGRGFKVGSAVVPIVPAAVVFDLLNGGDKTTIVSPNPYVALGEWACRARARTTGLGTIGAGTGATTANLKGGFGAALAPLSGGGTMEAYVVVNAAGRATFGEGPHLRAAAFERDGEFGGLGLPEHLPADAASPVTKLSALRASTTIAVVATDLELTKSEAAESPSPPMTASRSPYTRPTRRSTAIRCSASPRPSARSKAIAFWR